MTIKVYLTSALLVIYQFVSSQTKTYSGQYEGGTATYQYIENADFERIMNGAFSYKKTIAY